MGVNGMNIWEANFSEDGDFLPNPSPQVSLNLKHGGGTRKQAKAINHQFTKLLI